MQEGGGRQPIPWNQGAGSHLGPVASEVQGTNLQAGSLPRAEALSWPPELSRAHRWQRKSQNHEDKGQPRKTKVGRAPGEEAVRQRREPPGLDCRSLGACRLAAPRL